MNSVLGVLSYGITMNGNWSLQASKMMQKQHQSIIKVISTTYVVQHLSAYFKLLKG